MLSTQLPVEKLVHGEAQAIPPFKPPPSKIPTIYFENFPSSVDKKFMDQILKTYNIMGTSNIPKKRNQIGLRFGFIQLDEGSNFLTALDKLNQVIVGDHHIRAFEARYQKKQQGDAIQTTTHPRSKQNCGSLQEISGVRSYANVLSGVRSTEIVFNTEGKNLEWLSRSARISVASGDDLSLISDLLRSFSKEPVKISPLGYHSALITFPSVDLCNFFLMNDIDCVKYLIKEKTSWCSKMADSEREIWVRIVGVPLQAWSAEFFSLVGGKLGRLIDLDKDTEEKSNLVEARIKIATTKQSIENSMRVVIDRQPFQIFITEETSNVQAADFSKSSGGGYLQPDSQHSSADTVEHCINRENTFQNLNFEKHFPPMTGEAVANNVTVGQSEKSNHVSSKSKSETLSEDRNSLKAIQTATPTSGANTETQRTTLVSNPVETELSKGEVEIQVSKGQTQQCSRTNKNCLEQIPEEVINYIQLLEKKTKKKHKKKNAEVGKASKPAEKETQVEAIGFVRDADAIKDILNKRILLEKPDRVNL